MPRMTGELSVAKWVEEFSVSFSFGWLLKARQEQKCVILFWWDFSYQGQNNFQSTRGKYHSKKKNIYVCVRVCVCVCVCVCVYLTVFSEGSLLGTKEETKQKQNNNTLLSGE